MPGQIVKTIGFIAILCGLGFATIVAVQLGNQDELGRKTPVSEDATGCAELKGETISNVCDIPVNVGICPPTPMSYHLCGSVVEFTRTGVAGAFTSIQRRNLQTPPIPDTAVLPPIRVHACPQPYVAGWYDFELRCFREI